MRCVLCRVGGVGVFGDGEPLPMRHSYMQPRNQTKMISSGVTYPAHLRGLNIESHTSINPAYRLVVNHYVTRAQDEFIERKIKLGGTGKFAKAFDEILQALDNMDDMEEAYRRFEADFGFDGDHAICRQGAAVAAEMRAAQASGAWSAVPRQPGLLGGGMARLLRGG